MAQAATNGSRRVGLIGVGNIGIGLLESLIRNDYDVLIYDVSQKALDNARQFGSKAIIVSSAAELWDGVDTILLSLPKPQHVVSVLFDAEGLADRQRSSKLVIDLSTNSPTITQDAAAKLKAIGHRLVDAPVSGGKKGAATGTLAIMVGGDSDAIEAAMPVLAVLGKNVKAMGGSGAGQISKLVNNMLTAANRVVAAEALYIGERAGVPMTDLVSMVNTATGSSYITQNHYPNIIFTGNRGTFTMDLMYKDIRLMLDVAEQQGINTPVMRAVVDRFLQLKGFYGDDACTMLSTQLGPIQDRDKLADVH